MKLYELNEQQLDEVPANIFTQFGRKAGSRVLNKLPGGAAKSKAYNLAGKADLGDTANLFHRQFANYLGQQDKNVAQATGEDLMAFLKIKKVSDENIPDNIPSGVLQKRQLDTLITDISKNTIATKSGSRPDPRKANDQNTDIDGDGKPDETDNAKIISDVIPDDMLEILKNLSTEQRQELLKLL